jgi:Zn-dependent protease
VPGNNRRPAPHGVPLGRWAGIPVVADWSAAATLLLFTWLLAGDVLPSLRPHHPAVEYWLIGAGTAAVFLLMLLAHELAHAVTARHFGMRVSRITLWMLGGVTELDGQPPSPRADAAVALAGPLTSLTLGGGSAALTVCTTGMLQAAVAWLGAINIFLAVFNLLPAAPLDGGRVLRAALWHWRKDWVAANAGAAAAGRVLGMVLIGLGIVEVLAGAIAGLWLALIGWFVLVNAAGERYVATVDIVGGLTLADVMTPVDRSVPDWWTVQRALDELVSEPPATLLPMLNFAGQATGVITAAELQRVPVGDRDEVRVRELRHRPVAATLPPSTPVREALPLLSRGAIVDIVRTARTRQARERPEPRGVPIPQPRPDPTWRSPVGS